MYHLFYTNGSELFAAHVALEEIGSPYTADILNKITTQNAVSDANRRDGLEIADRGDAEPGFLTEISAILLFLARNYPEAKLIPHDPYGEAQCLEWLSWLSIQVSGMAFAQVWHPDRVALDLNTYREMVTKGWWRIEEHFDRIEERLSDEWDWAVRSGYSIADIYLLVFWLWGERIGFSMKGRWPAWTRLMNKIMSRPAVRRAMLIEEFD
ncbi:glutathione S-transferase family protein [Rhizobium mayense]|uniref:Glutathione S-transferase family protein n=1 Tax=Rhizobium mayense TaxID=1312184 RepID=A0ABT7K438_9HYPH|nr:glutathione S-transferase family protein [Rhizobium mayense]MDL2403381.1 glutathione S-transferase family protein [Rhizobium mayense]